MLIIRLEGEGALDLHSCEFHVVQQHSIWGGPKHAKRQEGCVDSVGCVGRACLEAGWG